MRLPRLALVSVLLVVLVVGGTAGYALIEKWSLSESLYMVFITITTVGFGEVRPLSETGRHFTILLLVLSVATVGYSLSTLVAFFFEGQILRAVRERRMKRFIFRLRDHYIVCGAGEVGRSVALEFRRQKVKFVVIDTNPEASELGRDESIAFVQGDATDDEVLREAEIDRARGLVCALPDDESTLYVTLSARQLNPGLTIVARASGERAAAKLMKAGATRTISPTQIAGQRMASVVLRPTVLNFLDVAVEGSDLSMRIEEVEVPADSPIGGKTLRETAVGQQTGAIIVGIHGPDGKTRMNPSSNTTLSGLTLQPKDVLIALGSEEQLERLRRFVGHPRA